MSSLSRFQGSLLGVLIGDCLGAPFEGNRLVTKTHLKKYFTQLLDPSLKLPFKKYTDDTAMTKSVAESLIACRKVDYLDMAKRFVTEYNKDPKRGYGATVGHVFDALRLSSFEDPFGPAARQFGGMGSYGNGAAMRVSPISLYFAHQDSSLLLQGVDNCSKITHANELGIWGANLQALAVSAALKSTPPLDTDNFIDHLISAMLVIEGPDAGKDVQNPDPLAKDPETSYVKKLELVKAFLNRPDLPDTEEVDKFLGVSVSAHRSVPTAVYCFLAAQKPIPDIETENVFQRTIMYAFSLGGDTDTIGSMAGAMAGAAVGMEGIPSGLLHHCEATSEVLHWAEDLFNLSRELASSSSSAAATADAQQS